MSTGHMKRAVLALALVGCSAHAEFKSGNTLLAQIKGDNLDYIHANGYVIGVYDTLQGVTHCPPAGITAGQVTDIVKNYLEVNPETRHNSADRLIGIVLKSTWPCAQRPPAGRQL